MPCSAGAAKRAARPEPRQEHLERRLRKGCSIRWYETIAAMTARRTLSNGSAGKGSAQKMMTCHRYRLYEIRPNVTRGFAAVHPVATWGRSTPF